MANGTLRLPAVTAASVPTPPSGKTYIFLDTSDKHVKSKDDTGTVVDLASVGLSGIAADSGGTATGPTVTLTAGTNITTSRSGNTITIGTSGVLQAKYAMIGSVVNVGGNSTTVGTFSDASATAEVVMAYGGSVVAISISLNAARTAGTCVARVRKNAVAQTGASQTVTIDGTNTTTNRQIISPAITFAAGDILGIETLTTSFTPTGSDATITIWVVES